MVQSTLHFTSPRLTWSAQYHGPNPFAVSAVVVADLVAEEIPTVEQVKRACRQLSEASGIADFQNWAECQWKDQEHHDDALFWLGMTAASWARAALNEVRGCIEHAGVKRDGDKVRIWVGFHHPQLSRATLQLALNALTDLLNERFSPPRLMTELKKLWQACGKYHPDFQARILMLAAREMDVPFMPFLTGTRNWQFGWGNRSKVFLKQPPMQMVHWGGNGNATKLSPRI